MKFLGYVQRETAEAKVASTRPHFQNSLANGEEKRSLNVHWHVCLKAPAYKCVSRK